MTISMTDFDSSGISTIESDSEAETIWYNLNGVQVNENTLHPGCYIRKSGTKTSKILVK